MATHARCCSRTANQTSFSGRCAGPSLLRQAADTFERSGISMAIKRYHILGAKPPITTNPVEMGIPHTPVFLPQSDLAKYFFVFRLYDSSEITKSLCHSW